MEVSIVELSGRSFLITNLKPSDTVKTLYDKLLSFVDNGSVAVVVDDRILNFNDMTKQLQDLGIKSGMTLPVVRMCRTDIYEFSGLVGDEDATVRQYMVGNTLVRVAFTSEATCMLVRETYIKHSTGSFTWDICRGTYSIREDNVAVCEWQDCYRRRRAAVERRGCFSLDDSGWHRRAKIPDMWKQLDLCGGSWAKQQATFQDRDKILGIRLSGRGNLAEAITLLAI